MKLEDIRGKDSRELKIDVNELVKEQFEMRFKEDVANSSRFQEIRRTIARIKTVLRQREIAEAAADTSGAQN